MNIENDYEEEDAAILRRTLRINKPERFAIKEID